MFTNLLLVLLLSLNYNVLAVCVLDYSKCLDYFGFEMCQRAQNTVNSLIVQINDKNLTEIPYFFLECEKALACTFENNINKNGRLNTYFCTSGLSRDLCTEAKNYYAELADKYGNLLGYAKVPINCVDYVEDEDASSANRPELFKYFLYVFGLLILCF